MTMHLKQKKIKFKPGIKSIDPQHISHLGHYSHKIIIILCLGQSSQKPYPVQQHISVPAVLRSTSPGPTPPLIQTQLNPVPFAV